MKINRKKSLANIFTVLAIFLLSIFIIISSFSYLKLVNYNTLMDDLINDSIPNIIETSNIYSQVNELIYLSEKLNNSKTQAFRRVTYDSIIEKIDYIKGLGDDTSNKNINLLIKLNLIQNELIQLNSLIAKRLILENKIDQEIQKLYELNNNIILLENNTKYETLRFDFASIINLTYQSLNLTKLSNLRENINKITNIKNSLKNKIYAIPSEYKSMSKYLQDIDKNIFSKDGILNLKVQQLIINGRARGRGNFVNNMIKDFSSQVEYNSFKSRKKTIEEAVTNSEKSKDQISYMIVLFVIGILSLIAVIYYINKKVVARLTNLNESIKDNLLGNIKPIEDNMEDEISQIIDTFNYYSNKINEQKEELEQLSLTDPLTNLANRRAFDLYLLDRINYLKRNDHKCISFLLMDIDFFKLYNDYYGHIAGDKVIQDVSKVLKESLQRDIDLVARYGGEEFICILPDTDKDGALQIAKRIITSLQDLKIEHEKNKVSKYLSISIGINTIDSKSSLDTKVIIKETDDALYLAKENGRNRFYVSK